MEGLIYWTEKSLSLEEVEKLVSGLGYATELYPENMVVYSNLRATPTPVSTWIKTDRLDHVADDEATLQHFAAHHFTKRGIIIIEFSKDLLDPVLKELIFLLGHIMGQHAGFVGVDYTARIFGRDELGEIKQYARDYYSMGND